MTRGRPYKSLSIEKRKSCWNLRENAESGRDYLLILNAGLQQEVLLRLGLFPKPQQIELKRLLVPESAFTAESRRVIAQQIVGSVRSVGSSPQVRVPRDPALSNEHVKHVRCCQRRLRRLDRWRRRTCARASSELGAGQRRSGVRALSLPP